MPLTVPSCAIRGPDRGVRDDRPTHERRRPRPRRDRPHVRGARRSTAGGVNRLEHNRVPTPLDHQTVIRMNRDTLYSIGDRRHLRRAQRSRFPRRGERYVSVMIVNQDHYINRIFHDAGKYDLNIDEFDTPYVAVRRSRARRPERPRRHRRGRCASRSVRRSSANSDRPFIPTDCDTTTLDATRNALLDLGRNVSGFDGAFGAKAERRSGRASASAPRPARADSPRPKRSTSTSTPAFRSDSTSFTSPTFRSTASGRSRSTTADGYFPDTGQPGERERHHRRA